MLLLWSCGYCICGLLPRPGLGQLSCDLLAMNMASSSPPELRLTSAIATRMRDGLGVVVGRPESCAPRHSRWLHGQPQGPGTRRRSRSSMSNNADEGNGRYRGEHGARGKTRRGGGQGGTPRGRTGTGHGGRGEYRGGARARGMGEGGHTAGEHGARGEATHPPIEQRMAQRAR